MNTKPKQKGETKMAENKPVHTVRIGTTRASVWKNEGKKGTWFNVSVTRSYLDGNDWKETSQFRPDDLLVLAKVADLAHTWCVENRDAEQA